MNERKEYEAPVLRVETGFEREVLASGGGCIPETDSFPDCQGYVTPSA